MIWFRALAYDFALGLERAVLAWCRSFNAGFPWNFTRFMSA